MKSPCCAFTELLLVSPTYAKHDIKPAFPPMQDNGDHAMMAEVKKINQDKRPRR